MTDADKPSERRKHTPDSVMEELIQCKSEVGIQVETLRSEFSEHKDAFKKVADDWEEFKTEFTELLHIFRTFKSAIQVLNWIAIAAKWITITGLAFVAIYTLVTTGHWPGIGE